MYVDYLLISLCLLCDLPFLIFFGHLLILEALLLGSFCVCMYISKCSCSTVYYIFIHSFTSSPLVLIFSAIILKIVDPIYHPSYPYTYPLHIGVRFPSLPHELPKDIPTAIGSLTDLCITYLKGRDGISIGGHFSKDSFKSWMSQMHRGQGTGQLLHIYANGDQKQREKQNAALRECW